MVSRFVGRGQNERIDGMVGTATKSALLVTLPLVAISLLLPDRVLSVFTLEASLLATGVDSLRVVALGMLVIIPGEMWFNTVVGVGDTRAALAIEASLACLIASYAWMKAGVWRQLDF